MKPRLSFSNVSWWARGLRPPHAVGPWRAALGGVFHWQRLRAAALGTGLALLSILGGGHHSHSHCAGEEMETREVKCHPGLFQPKAVDY